jgi:DGQHR domain-containing protein
MKKYLEITAFRYKQFGLGKGAQPIDLYSVVVPVKLLMERGHIDCISRDNPDGYQRLPDERRLVKGKRAITKYILEAWGIFPTSILVNIRDSFEFEPATKITNHIEFGTLKVPAEAIWWIIDGQHRFEALKRAKSENPSAPIEDYPIPVTILALKDKFEEMLVFHIVNSEAKSVPTDLAAYHMQRIVERIPHVPDWIAYWLDLRKTKIGVAGVVTQLLGELENSPWKGRIAFYGEKTGGQFIVDRYTLVQYINKDILKDPTFHQMDAEQIAKELADYWKAIEELYPEAFRKPEDYYITQTTGIAAFTKIYPLVRGLCTQTEPVSKNALKKILQGLLTTTDPGYLKQHVAGYEGDFARPMDLTWWAKGTAPAIARMTSEAMFNILARGMAAKIQRYLRGYKKSAR